MKAESFRVWGHFAFGHVAGAALMGLFVPANLTTVVLQGLVSVAGLGVGGFLHWKANQIDRLQDEAIKGVALPTVLERDKWALKAFVKQTIKSGIVPVAVFVGDMRAADRYLKTCARFLGKITEIDWKAVPEEYSPVRPPPPTEPTLCAVASVSDLDLPEGVVLAAVFKYRYPGIVTVYTRTENGRMRPIESVQLPPLGVSE